MTFLERATNKNVFENTISILSLKNIPKSDPMFQRLSVKVTSLNMLQPHSYVSSSGSSFHYGRNDFFVSGTLFRYVSSIFWVECKPLVAAGWLVTLHSCHGGDRSHDDYGPVCLDPLSSKFVQASQCTNKAGESTH